MRAAKMHTLTAHSSRRCYCHDNPNLEIALYGRSLLVRACSIERQGLLIMPTPMGFSIRKGTVDTHDGGLVIPE
jgi:hypothetical protein